MNQEIIHERPTELRCCAQPRHLNEGIALPRLGAVLSTRRIGLRKRHKTECALPGHWV